ncbi:hypothetical protein E4U31_001185 [Claviceps sp. LM219 group G6]|nr:hypothetical protein E4U31_001185 [Claviceps sp. LM219 group G6]
MSRRDDAADRAEDTKPIKPMRASVERIGGPREDKGVPLRRDDATRLRFDGPTGPLTEPFGGAGCSTTDQSPELGETCEWSRIGCAASAATGTTQAPPQPPQSPRGSTTTDFLAGPE